MVRRVVVQAVGGFDQLKVGNRVVVHCPQAGACAELITVTADSLLVIPDNLSFEVAASFTISYLTAYFSLFHLGGLRAGGAVLIHSAAGGVGWAATQLAKTVPGVTVFGTASLQKHEAIKENGVDHPIHYDQDYHREVLEQRPRGVSIVLDNLGGTNFTISQDLLEPLGKVILIGARGMVGNEHRSLWRVLKTWWTTKNVSPYSLIMKNHAVAGFNLNELRSKDPATFRQGWEEILKMITSEELRPCIDSVWQFDQIIEASKQISERKNIGKVIICP
ncbi:synaptic vesicle membrane protein VAT-1 homolog isoform X2 [Homarus americanus]|uniref:synaptic vesicle membrane protein VAT-1 homolog isoform X2 n=1 Tax=Homarus americanus TaxID=6706 RepID=UPI001C439257|nr:synaptic vesicle membrane protein VAT-1 homolog isoform X2 [Homarus americanus]